MVRTIITTNNKLKHSIGSTMSKWLPTCRHYVPIFLKNAEKYKEAFGKLENRHRGLLLKAHSETNIYIVGSERERKA